MKTINEIAQAYVKLSLKIGQHSEYYVDAYYGPEQWRPTADSTSLPQLKNEALMLLEQAQELPTFDCPEKNHRMTFLLAHIKSSATYIDQLQGNQLDFRSECKALYDVQPPEFNESHFDKILVELDALVPGVGDLNQRLDSYRQEFVVKKDRLDKVFAAAINEARARTLRYIDIPEQENFNVELVDNQIWSAYNWYKGDSYSLIQLNTDHPIFIDRVIDLAAHEGYPGHHVFNALIEKHLVNANGWMEYSVYNLFSPLSLLAEGSANYGIEVAFPWQERMQFERETLFVLAGIPAEKAELYYQIQSVLHQLSYVDNMVAQRYLDGEIDEAQAVQLLMKYALSSEQRSKQRLRFIEHNRAYVITYNYGQDLVKDFLAAKVDNTNQDDLWRGFSDLLSRPKTGSMMQSEI